MVRTYQRKSTRGSYGREVLNAAVQAVSSNGMPLLRASKFYNIPVRTLGRHCKGQMTVPGSTVLGPYKTTLSATMEGELYNHIKFMEKSLYGLTAIDVRKLAFEIAEAAECNHPFSKENKMVGKDWLSGFLKRHQDLSIRSPQATNLSRAVAFNREKVKQFFTLYGDLLSDHGYTPSRIWNMDETGVSTVQKPGKIVATKGARLVGKVTSGERGQTVTAICGMNAAGMYIPPMFIFPRKRMVDSLMNGSPPQSVGYCSANGWTDSSLFLQWLQHFQKCTNASKSAQQIIILDGHHSHP